MEKAIPYVVYVKGEEDGPAYTVVGASPCNSPEEAKRTARSYNEQNKPGYYDVSAVPVWAAKPIQEGDPFPLNSILED